MTEFAKGDRAARLVRIANLLRNQPQGLTVREIADRVGVAARTVNRDLLALDSEVQMRLWQDGPRYGLSEDAFLPPLQLTLLEAVTLFLAARLMDRFQDRSDPHVLAAFEKMASVLPITVARHVEATLASMAERPRDRGREKVFDLLATAWAERRRARIMYPRSEAQAEVLVQRVVDPYYLEPNPGGHARYIIGRDSLSGGVRTFRIERIRSVELLDETFEAPSDLDVGRRLRHSFVISDEDLVEVRLRFHSSDAAQRAFETRWHDSQKMIRNQDGTADMLLNVSGLRDLTPWILGWGERVEVLAPPALRTAVAARFHAGAAMYAGGA